MKVEPEIQSHPSEHKTPELSETATDSSNPTSSTSHHVLKNSNRKGRSAKHSNHSPPINPKYNPDQNKSTTKDEEEREEQELLEMARHELQKSNRGVKESRQRLPTRVTVALERVFEVNNHPSIAIIRALAAKHNEDENRIKVWFSNNRGKQKRELIRKRIERSAFQFKQSTNITSSIQQIQQQHQQNQQQIQIQQKEQLPLQSSNPKARPLLPNVARPPMIHPSVQTSHPQSGTNPTVHPYLGGPPVAQIKQTKVTQTLSESELLSSRIYVRNTAVDLNDPNSFPITFEFALAMRERILQLQELIKKQSNEAQDALKVKKAIEVNSMPTLRSSLCNMILKCLEPACQSLKSEGQYQVKRELNLPKQLIKTLLEVYRALEAKGFGKVILAQHENTVVSCLVVTAEMLGGAFGEEHEGACIILSDRTFRIERLVLSFDEKRGCLGVSAMLICQISPN